MPKSTSSLASSRKKQAILTSMFTIAMFGFFTTVLLLTVLPTHGKDLDYAVVLDAGSSHTSANVFAWPTRTSQELPLLEPADLGQASFLESKNPISGYVFNNDPSSAGDSLRVLMDYVKTQIPADRWKHTSVRLGATAGMREAVLYNATASAVAMESVRTTLATYPFNFKPEWAEIINGTMEGVYGWMTVNFLTNFLDKGYAAGQSVAMDLGGASTQVTFVPKKPPKSENYTLCIYDQCRTLYSHSYLGYGLAEATKKYRSLIAPSAPVLEDPCFPKGVQTNVSGTIYNGSSDPSACIALVDMVVNKSSCANTPDTAVNCNYMPPIPQGRPIHAFSAFAYFAVALSKSQDFDFPLPASLAKLKTAQNKLCGMTAQQVAQALHGDKYASSYCFAATYTLELLGKGYSIPNSTTITFATSVDGEDLGWAMGAAVMLENLLPWQPGTKPKHILHPPMSVGLLAMSTTLLIIGILATLLLVRRYKLTAVEAGLLDARESI